MAIKIINKIFHLIILLFCFLMQYSFLEQLKMFHIYFDPVLVAIIIFTIWDGPFYGILFGFFAGLATDIITGSIAGIHAFVYSLIPFVVSRLLESGFKQKIAVYVFIVFISTEIGIIVIALLRYLFNFDLLFTGIGLEMLLKPVYNVILILGFYPLLRLLQRRKEDLEF